MLKIAYHEIYQHPLPEGHRFPMLKYELIPKQLMYEGIITVQNLFQPEPASEHVIILTHEKEYWSRLKHLELSVSEMRKVGFPLSGQLVEREVRIAKGTIDASLFAIRYGAALNIAGGTHHAFADRGEGFCLLNDFAIAANYLLTEKIVERILIVDLDVHQGNGTARIFMDDPRVFTFSMHGKDNYPFHKEKSDLDIELLNGTGDEAYLDLMKQHIPGIIDKIRPEIIFYLSGVDVLATDKYGKLNLSLEGCAERDKLLFSWCKQQCIPVIVSMGGGYSSKISDIVNAHCNTFKSAAEVFFN